MHFKLLSHILLFGAVLADLECKDFILPNWTTDRVRLNVIDATAVNPYTNVPANLTATNPARVASKTRPGSRFHMQTCNSTSLDFEASNVCTNNNDGTGYTRSFAAFLQIIDVYGNCLTGIANKNVTWKACNENPSSVSQIWGAEYEYKCTQDCCSDPSAVDQYPAFVEIVPPYRSNNVLFFDLASDPKHQILALTNRYKKLDGHFFAMFALAADATK